MIEALAPESTAGDLSDLHGRLCVELARFVTLLRGSAEAESDLIRGEWDRRVLLLFPGGERQDGTKINFLSNVLDSASSPFNGLPVTIHAICDLSAIAQQAPGIAISKADALLAAHARWIVNGGHWLPESFYTDFFGT